jgi:hypothetical protein
MGSKFPCLTNGKSPDCSDAPQNGPAEPLDNRKKRGEVPRGTDWGELTKVRFQGPQNPNVLFSATPNDGNKQPMLAKMEK